MFHVYRSLYYLTKFLFCAVMLAYILFICFIFQESKWADDQLDGKQISNFV